MHIRKNLLSIVRERPQQCLRSFACLIRIRTGCNGGPQGKTCGGLPCRMTAGGAAGGEAGVGGGRCRLDVGVLLLATAPCGYAVPPITSGIEVHSASPVNSRMGHLSHGWLPVCQWSGLGLGVWASVGAGGVKGRA